MSLQRRLWPAPRTVVFGAVVALATVALGVQLFAQDGKHQGAGPEYKPTEDWIVEDIEAGYALAKETGKPLLVAFR